MGIFGQIWVFVALQVFSAINYYFTDDTNFYGMEKPVAMNLIMFILSLFHINSAFSIVDRDPADTSHASDAINTTGQ